MVDILIIIGLVIVAAWAGTAFSNVLFELIKMVYGFCIMSKRGRSGYGDGEGSENLEDGTGYGLGYHIESPTAGYGFGVAKGEGWNTVFEPEELND